jgi:signal transduction histidine kinase
MDYMLHLIHNMAGVKKIDLKWIKGLMLFSQVLLVLFTAQWLYSQYNDQQAQLKTNLTKLYTDVQHKITDSLLLTHAIETEAVNSAYTNPDEEASLTTDNDQGTKLSPEALHKLLSTMGNLSSVERTKMFHMDTILFNDIFTNAMRSNGWSFSSQWINASDSNKKSAGAIFIQSNFFTNANGIVVDHCAMYLMGKLVPQILFVLILLALTGAAFWVTYKSLKAQIKLSHLKDDFISNMSHELKTPIATVKVALEALNNYNIIDNPKLNREYLGMAAAEMDRLELLATRVLNTSLLESGRIYLQQETYDLKMLVEEVLQSMQPRFQKNDAKISLHVTGDNFLIPVDKLHMQGVLVNLLDNSLKYGDKPIHIDIQLTENNGAIRMALADNGPGIPEEFREKVFEKFFRVPTGNRHNIKGHGLGLSYAAQVMRQHNGSIQVNNVAAGGCMFTLSF